MAFLLGCFLGRFCVHLVHAVHVFYLLYPLGRRIFKPLNAPLLLLHTDRVDRRTIKVDLNRLSIPELFKDGFVLFFQQNKLKLVCLLLVHFIKTSISDRLPPIAKHLIHFQLSAHKIERQHLIPFGKDVIIQCRPLVEWIIPLVYTNVRHVVVWCVCFGVLFVLEKYVRFGRIRCCIFLFDARECRDVDVGLGDNWIAAFRFSNVNFLLELLLRPLFLETITVVGILLLDQQAFVWVDPSSILLVPFVKLLWMVQKHLITTFRPVGIRGARKH